MSDDLRKIANASGFMFQLAVEHAVRSSRNRRKWRPTAREIPWFDQDTTEQRFADLLLVRGSRDRLVVECKRTKDADWVFLAPASVPERTKYITTQWIQNHPSTGPRGGWTALEWTPESPVAEFCAIRGTGEGNVSLLERIGAPLARAAEYLADAELEEYKKAGAEGFCIFVPVIVTTAKLHVCRFQEEQVSLLDGKLPEADGEFEEVPLVRFTKSLSAVTSDATAGASLGRRMSQAMRTVLVINSERLVDTIEEWGLYSDGQECPWHVPGASGE